MVNTKVPSNGANDTLRFECYARNASRFLTEPIKMSWRFQSPQTRPEKSEIIITHNLEVTLII